MALKWEAVKLGSGHLSVSESVEHTRSGKRVKETKSGRGRLVAMPSFLVEELRKHRLRQDEELLRLGSRSGDDTYVVAQADGARLHPETLTHEFVRILALNPTLPRVRFYDLRHSHATHLLASGVHPKIARRSGSATRPLRSRWTCTPT